MGGVEQRVRSAAPQGRRTPAPVSRPAVARRGGGATPAEWVLQLQRTIGNRAVGQLLQRMADPQARAATLTPPGAGAAVLQRKLVTIGSEQVDVENQEQAQEARRIIEAIRATYGIEISSLAGVQAQKTEYPKAPEATKGRLATRFWKLSELQAAERALAHYAPILGARRASSSRAGAEQEVTSLSKQIYSIGEDSPEGKVSDLGTGEYFPKGKNVSLFKGAETHSTNFPGNIPKQTEGTLVHELAHGLLDYALDDFVKAFPYWKSRYTRRYKGWVRDIEAPPTNYGKADAEEDLSETAMKYFVAPESLKAGHGGKEKGQVGNPCPERFQFMEDLVKGWKQPPAPRDPTTSASPSQEGQGLSLPSLGGLIEAPATASGLSDLGSEGSLQPLEPTQAPPPDLDPQLVEQLTKLPDLQLI